MKAATRSSATLQHEEGWDDFSLYVKSHCTICTAGWTRTSEDGDRFIMCLLDREPVMRDMIHCDRFERQPMQDVMSKARRE